MKSHYATISTRQSRKVRPQGPLGVVSQIPQAGVDGGRGDARPRSSEQIAAENELHIISGKVAADHCTCSSATGHIRTKAYPDKRGADLDRHGIFHRMEVLEDVAIGGP
jgi:hypothetical protein